MTSIKSLLTINAGDGVQKKESSYTVGGMQTITATRENSVVAPKKLKLELPYD